MPCKSEKAIPYKYGATMIEEGREVPLPSIVNIADISRVTRSGRIFNRGVGEPVKEKVPQKDTSDQPMGQSSAGPIKKNDEMLKLIQKSEYNIVDQLLQTPSRISVLSLLLSSGAYREALQKVLEQAFVE